MDQKPTPSSPEKIQSEDTSKLNPSPTVYRSHWKYIASGVILIILGGIGAFFAGQKSTDKTNEVADTTSRPTSILITPSLGEDQPDWLKYESKEIEGKYDGWTWRSFVLHYPSTWSIAEELYSTESISGPTFTLKLVKDDGSYFELLQGFADGGRCVYESDPDSETYQGAGSAYTTYDEIVKGDEKWRLSAYKVPDQLWTHQLCGLSKNGVYQSSYNSLGIHKIKLVNGAAYKEFLEMLKKVEMK